MDHNLVIIFVLVLVYQQRHLVVISGVVHIFGSGKLMYERCRLKMVHNIQLLSVYLEHVFATDNIINIVSVLPGANAQLKWVISCLNCHWGLVGIVEANLIFIGFVTLVQNMAGNKVFNSTYRPSPHNRS